MAFKFITLLACVSVSFASAQLTGFNNNLDFNFNDDQQEIQETTTPVPILRFVDTQNADGSYTYGYENGDGTYKIETRYVTGEVKGKYGYYDDTGALREVAYGASKMGFEPTGTGLDYQDAPVAPAAPVIAPTVAPRSAPIAPVAPVTRNNNGRRVKVVRRRRPQQQSVAQETQRSAVLETVNDRNNQYDPRVNKQFQRKQQAGSERSQGVSKPIINRRLQIRPATATTPRPAQFANFAQPAQPAQFAQSVQPAQSAHADALRAHQVQLQELKQQQYQLEQLHAQQQRQEQRQQIPFQRQQQFQQNIFVPQQKQQQQFQQNNFGPVSAPVQQAQAPSQFVASAGSASNINLNTGTYSISY
jgi:hypothetical protein